MSAWTTLKIERTNDVKAIKKAYAVLVKQHKPEQDPEGYQRIREAFDQAVKWAKQHPDFATTPDSVPAPDIQREPAPKTEPAPEPEPQPESPSGPVSTLAFDLDEPAPAPEPGTRTRANRKVTLSDVINELIQRMEHALFNQGDDAAIDVIDQAIASDIFLNIDHRQHLSDALFEWATGWNQKHSPYRVFEFLLEEFGWRNDAYQPRSDQQLSYLEHRIRAAREYELLHHAHTGPRFFVSTEQSQRRRIAGVLLGEFRPAYFYWLMFTHTLFKQVTGKLRQLKTKAPLIFEYELKNDTTAWLLQHLNGYPYSVSHLIIGAIPAAFITAWALELPPIMSLAGSVHPLAIMSLLFGSTLLLGSGLIWILLRGAYSFLSWLKATWKVGLARARPRYEAITNRINQRPLLFNALYFVTTMVFVGCLFVEGLSQWILWSTGMLLAVLLWNERFLAVMLNYGVATIVMAAIQRHEEATFILPGSPMEYSIFVAFLSSHLISGLLNSIPEKVSDFILDSFIIILVTEVFMAALFIKLIYQANQFLM